MLESNVSRVAKYLEESRAALSAALEDARFLESVGRVADIIINALQQGQKLLIAGNGGSAADAQHLATELMVRFYHDRRPLPALALGTDASCATAIGNDIGFEQVFARQILALGQKGDVFLALSTSGQSPNIIAGCMAARDKGMTVIGFTGSGGGGLARICDIALLVPATKTPLIQQMHKAAGHIVCEIVESALMAQS